MSVNKVLVVDDSPTQLDHLRDIVIKTGRSVMTASSGLDALDLVKKEKPDLVLLDIVMDDLDGYGTCREIVKNPETKDIPVVFVSTKNQRADKLWASKQGAKQLISKPYEENEILEVLNSY